MSEWFGRARSTKYTLYPDLPLTAGAKEFLSGDHGLGSVAWDAIGLGGSMIFECEWLKMVLSEEQCTQ